MTKKTKDCPLCAKPVFSDAGSDYCGVCGMGFPKTERREDFSVKRGAKKIYYCSKECFEAAKRE